ncbi:hypothetical protein CPB84DRAFT_1797264 [Gymnopilus junonius]|uniref:HNH nuclease domain-containing protein n=1 Tax=Gymnopilus junonius TaxID=109634 RepID=A0A9P5N8K1_GYMJU|nr:hypothetical protein CPB84DRAFT_1797264 [Gymnopilus junonius]
MCSLTLTSCSSEAAVEFYEKRLKPGIDTLRNSCTPLRELVGAAEKIINEKFTPDARSTYKYKKDSKEISVGLDKIMLAMLACAEECGGESGKRYVVSAISACSEEEDVVGALEALGTTWLTHLLFIFKTSKAHGHRPSKNSFSDNVIIRDGYACVLTGFQDSSHPKPAEGIPRLGLVGAHILPRAIGAFDNDHDSGSFQSAMTMFDILVNFACLPVQTLEELRGKLDDASNGMTLQYDAYDAFDRFYWCLKPTEKEHVYDLKIFKSGGILRKPGDNRISFQDHGNDFLPASMHKRNRPVNLPDPSYIAIHAAIAGVLNMSGAGRFFDELLGEYKDKGGNVPAVRSWQELETLMEDELIRESIMKAFQSVVVR